MTSEPGSYLKRIQRVITGSAIGQIALIASAPALARLYDPRDLGEYAGLIAGGTMFAFVVTAGLEQAVPASENESEASRRATAGMAVTIGATLSTLAIGTAVWALGAESAGRILVLLALVSFAVAMQELVASVAVQLLRDAALANSRAAHGVLMAVFQILFGLLTPTVLALLGGFIAAKLIVSIWLSLSVRWRPTGLSPHSVVQEQRQFALYAVPAAVLGNTAGQIPALLVPAFFGLDVAGQLVIAQRVLGSPTRLITRALTQVFYGEVGAIAEDESSVRDLVTKTRRYTLWFGAPICFAIGAAGYVLIEPLFGTKWSQSPLFVVLLIPRAVGLFVEGPLSRLLLLYDRQRDLLVWTASRSALAIGALTLPAVGGRSEYVAVGAYSIALLTFSYRLVFVSSRAVDDAFQPRRLR